MELRELVAKIRSAIKNVESKTAEDLNPYQVILNKVYLSKLEALCELHTNDRAKVGFTVADNPFIKLQSDLNELTLRLKAQKLIKDDSLICNSLSMHIAMLLAGQWNLMQNINYVREYKSADDFLVPKREYYPLNEVPLCNMNSIATLLLRDIDNLPLDKKDIDPAIYFASGRSKAEIRQFLITKYLVKDRIEITKPEMSKWLLHAKSRFEHIGGSKADYDVSDYSAANRSYTLMAHYWIFADAAAKTECGEPIVEHVLRAHDIGGNANLRLLNYVNGCVEAQKIDLDEKLFKNPKWDTVVKGLFTNNELHNRLVLLKSLLIYYKDRENQYGLFSRKNSKCPAAYWAMDYVMRAKNLDGIVNIPAEHVKAFKAGELNKFTVLIKDASRQTAVVENQPRKVMG